MKNLIAVFFASALITNFASAPRAHAIVKLTDDSPESFRALFCFIPPIIFVFPICFLGEEGSSKEPPTKETLLENGYTEDDAARISAELAKVGANLKEEGKILQFQDTDTPESITRELGISLEAAHALLEISGRAQ